MKMYLLPDAYILGDSLGRRGKLNGEMSDRIMLTLLALRNILRK